MKAIFDYSDYREYIRDYYETNRAANSAFSLRYLAQKAGVNSSAFFKFLMEGKRNLTTVTILKVCKALKLKDKEAEYFESLVFFNQAKTIDEKNHFFDKLIKLQRLSNVKIIPYDQYDYFSEWYHAVVRELVCMVDFKEDFKYLGKCVDPPITESQARKSVSLLLDLGFLTVKDGVYLQSEPVISTGNSIKAYQVIAFQITMLKKAIESFDRHGVDQRLTSSTTFALSRKTYIHFVKEIRNLRQQLMEIASKEEDPESVYQLNLNLFPTGHKRESDRKGKK